jgi:hypothetical protein
MAMLIEAGDLIAIIGGQRRGLQCSVVILLRGRLTARGWLVDRVRRGIGRGPASPLRRARCWG